MNKVEKVFTRLDQSVLHLVGDDVSPESTDTHQLPPGLNELYNCGNPLTAGTIEMNRMSTFITTKRSIKVQ